MMSNKLEVDFNEIVAPLVRQISWTKVGWNGA